MPTPPYATRLADQLQSKLDGVPDAVDVVQLDQPDVATVQRRLAELVRRAEQIAGLESEPPELKTEQVRSLLMQPGRLRATGFHASGALSVTLALAPFDGLFERDPGDDELAELTRRTAEELGIHKLVPDDESLAFERLWRIRAAGGDPAGKVTEPVLCRAIGAFRHFVRDLPVYGRASTTVEVAAGGRLSSASVATAKVRTPEAAAHDVAARLVHAFGGLDDLKSTRLVPEWFRFGYLSLSRRHTQGLLAPFYIASVVVEREDEASAHVIAVPGSDVGSASVWLSRSSV